MAFNKYYIFDFWKAVGCFKSICWSENHNPTQTKKHEKSL